MARTSYKDRLIPARRRSVYFYCPVLPLVNRCFSPYTPFLCVLTAMTYYSIVCYGLLSLVSPLWETADCFQSFFCSVPWDSCSISCNNKNVKHLHRCWGVQKTAKPIENTGFFERWFSYTLTKKMKK